MWLKRMRPRVLSSEGHDSLCVTINTPNATMNKTSKAITTLLSYGHNRVCISFIIIVDCQSYYIRSTNVSLNPEHYRLTPSSPSPCPFLKGFRQFGCYSMLNLAYMCLDGLGICCPCGPNRKRG